MYICKKKKYTLEEARLLVSNSCTVDYIAPSLAKYYCKRCVAYHVSKEVKRRAEKMREETYMKYLEIAQLYSKGLTSEKIANKLLISLPTVRSAFVILSGKFKSTNRTHLIAILLREKKIQ